MKAALVICVFICALVSCKNAETGRPATDELSRVMDEANVLTPAEAAALAAISEALEESTGSQAVVLIVRDLQGEPIDAFSLKRANALGLGRKGYNDGVLITVSMVDHAARIDVGTGLEQIITNDYAASLIHDDLAASFREHQYFEGLLAVMRKIKTRIEQNEDAIGAVAQ